MKRKEIEIKTQEKNNISEDDINLLRIIKKLLVESKEEKKPDLETENLKDSDKFIKILKNKEDRKSYHTMDAKMNEKNEKIDENRSDLDKIEENENNIDCVKKERKPYTRIPKSEKDVYNYINSNGEYVGLFYGVKPEKIAVKVAKKIYLNTQKKDFELKIYNKCTDKIYHYRALVKEVEKVKKINGHIIPILHEIKVIRQ